MTVSGQPVTVLEERERSRSTLRPCPWHGRISWRFRMSPLVHSRVFAGRRIRAPSRRRQARHPKPLPPGREAAGVPGQAARRWQPNRISRPPSPRWRGRSATD